MAIKREDAKELLPILKAFAEGKTIQFKIDKGEWKNLENPTFFGNARDYRIKPER